MTNGLQITTFSRALLVAGSVGAAIAAWSFVVFPPGLTWHGAAMRTSIEWAGVAAYAGIAWVGLGVVFARYGPNSAVAVLALALVPTVLVVAGLALQPMHRVLEDAVDVWDGYAIPIRHGPLTHPSVHENVDNFYETVCALERRTSVAARGELCLEINLSKPRGQEVEGGYRFDFGQDDGPLPAPHDCFGKPVACRA